MIHMHSYLVIWFSLWFYHTSPSQPSLECCKLSALVWLFRELSAPENPSSGRFTTYIVLNGSSFLSKFCCSLSAGMKPYTITSLRRMTRSNSWREIVTRFSRYVKMDGSREWPWATARSEYSREITSSKLFTLSIFIPAWNSRLQPFSCSLLPSIQP